MFQAVIEALQANVVLIGLLVGAVTPLATSLVQQPRWSKQARQLVAVGVSVAVGFAVAASSGEVNSAGDLFSIVAAVWAASEAFYQKVWKASGIAGAVEAATSPSSTADLDGLHDMLGQYQPAPEPEGPEPEHLEHK